MGQAEDNLRQELQRLLRDVAPLQGALILVEAYRDVYGGEWQVKVDRSNNYVIEKVK
jgi:hypothetical protein